MVHITTRNAPYIHPSHDSIPVSWRTFPNGIKNDEVIVDVSCDSISSLIIPKMKQLVHLHQLRPYLFDQTQFYSDVI